jgi:hypothetical protein
VVGDDDAAVGRLHLLVGERGGLERLAAALRVRLVEPDFVDEGVVVADDGALRAQPVDDREGRRLAHVVDVALVGHADDEHPRAVERLALAVEAVGDELDDVLRHPRVDLFGEPDEA